LGDVAVRVEGLGKQYRLGGPREPYSTLRDQIGRMVSLRRLLRWAGRAESRPPFWALKDVSFEVQAGEAVGIIGRNGAGKSTLLKVLSRITEPTEGGADIHGRMGSLLEVGTGFHPELTGRENVYLNGAILGMRRAEIARKFAEIVAFAEVEAFVDTPVKHYSSGMYTRLAFAVAAHLEPEILVVDEVLAVGDAEFQKKCLGKMGEVARGGRTVLFVSHNMAAVQKLCTRCLVLAGGRVGFLGDTPAAVQVYLTSARDISGRLNTAGRTVGPNKVEVTEGWVEQDGEPVSLVTRCDRVEVVIAYEVREPVTFVAELVLRQQDGLPVAFSSSGLVQRLEIAGRPGRYVVRCRLPELKLAKGEYALDVIASELNVGYLDYVESGLGFAVDSAAIGEQGWNYSQSFGRGFLYWDVAYRVVEQP
jgi:lipopolysaccharide transport system ATP-binding protein